jgi:3-phenylpropionate/trans-cinnamate dioxygenase ferredoxin subunit
MSNWIEACTADAIEIESVLRVDYGDLTFAVYRGPDGLHYCTDGLCTHEAIHLADGLVIDYEIECPKHSAVFDYRTGEVLTPPACFDLRTFPIRVEGGKVWIDIG